jgi:hypothetical protein
MAAKTYRVTITTSATESSLEGEAEAVMSADGKQRLVCSCDEVGRGVSVEIKPLGADTQFVLHSIRVQVIPSKAGPEDP